MLSRNLVREYIDLIKQNMCKKRLKNTYYFYYYYFSGLLTFMINV